MASIVRSLSSEERALISYLWRLSSAGNALPPETLVEEMDDGGMRSLCFVSAKSQRSQERVAGACSFPDADGVLVEVALLLDRDDDPYQLDIWKVDFGSLIRIPDAALFSPLHEPPNVS